MRTLWVEDAWRQRFYTQGDRKLISQKYIVIHCSFPVVKTVLKYYLANQNLDVVSRKLLLEIISERNDRNQIIDLFPPEKKEKMLSKLILLGRI